MGRIRIGIDKEDIMNRSIRLLLVTAAILLLINVSAYAQLVFFDNFEYVVNRSDSNARELFMQNGGWSHVKTMQSASGARGFFYTVTSIPGFLGQFPGTNSSRVLIIEALPETYQGQTDLYLQLGNGESAAYDDYIPADVWFQFWAYPQYYGTQLSRWRGDDKFLYVCNTNYPCHSHLWMLQWGPKTYNPYFGTNTLGIPSNGEFNWLMRNSAGVGSIVYSPASVFNQEKLGPQDLTQWMKPNQWTLVKLHFVTSSTSGNSWEVWLRPYGGQWTKVSEWIGGTTPDFTWTIPSGSEGGHRVLRMPTTVGGTGRDWFDSWLYIDDFAVASSEDDLPTYLDGEISPPQAPRNLRIRY